MMRALRRFWLARREAPATRGFTLIEMMIVVAIVGLLASVAIPSFARYIQRSKTAEPLTNLPKIYGGVMAYYEQDHTTRSGLVPALQLPDSSPAVPAALASVAGTRYNPGPYDFDNETWNAVNFSMSTPILYQYQYCLGTGHVNANDCIDTSMDTSVARFEVVAIGDLDGDGVPSIFLRVGIRGTGTEIIGSPAIYFNQDE